MDSVLKVALITRSTLFTVQGGDTIQICETARELGKIGVSAQIKLSNEKIIYGEFDLLHFFNITRPADILNHIKKSSLPFVISPIFIQYHEFDQMYRPGIAGILFRYLKPNTIEYVKTIGRWVRGNDLLVSLSYLFVGQKRSVNTILKKTKMILPNSLSEYIRICKEYTYKGDYVIVPNGINCDLFEYDIKVTKDPSLVLCVARIEGLKNQINLIKALNNSKYKLLIIGAPSPNQIGYFRMCKKIAAGNIHFYGNISQLELKKYYSKASVHVLPSWFETTGLSSLEAAVMGCNIVITEKGDAGEYFGDQAFYCNPASPQSIYSAVEKASSQPMNKSLRTRIQDNFTWQKAASQTKNAYLQILSEKI